VCSFQSTGSTNITTVNALNRCGLYVHERTRGRGEKKRVWGIEMNEARQLYLTTYSAVDKIDQLLRSSRLKIHTYKWWHHPGLHGVAMAMCMAFEFYKECAMGGGDPSWMIDNPMDGPEFRETLNLQMLMYDPVFLKYPGDAALRHVTVKSRKRRRAAISSTETNEVCDDGQVRVGFGDYVNAKRPRGRGEVTRFGLESSDVLKKHLQSMKQVNGAKCEVCGKITFWRCELCDGARMCLKTSCSMTSMSCVLDYHAEDHFGLVRSDKAKFFGAKTGSFTGVKPAELKKNRAHIKKLRDKMQGGENVGA
jgi:hypothetical protein